MDMLSRAMRTLLVLLALSFILYPSASLAQSRSVYLPSVQGPGGSDITLVLTNSDSRPASVVLTPHKYDGPGSRNAKTAPITLTLDGMATRAVRTRELFGEAFVNGWVEVQADSPSVAGSFVLEDPSKGKETSELIGGPASRLLFPKITTDRSAANSLVLINTSEDKLTKVSIDLFESNGRMVLRRSVSLPAYGAWAGQVTDLFAGLGPFDGYAVINSGDADSLIGYEIFHSNSDFAGVTALTPSKQFETGNVTQFASQLGYSSTLVLINDGNVAQSVSVTIGGLEYNGHLSAASSDTELVMVASHQRLEVPIGELFELSGNDLITGYVRYQSQDDTTGLFGYLEIRTGDGRLTVVPVQGLGFENSFTSFVPDRTADARMLVVMNPGSLPASVKIETFDSSGYAVSSADLFLDPGARSSRLIEDSQTANRNGGSMLIKASSVVLALQIMGSPGTGGSLAVLPAHAGAGESEQAVPLLSAMNGGTAVSIDRGARISIPPGAMEHDAAIQITPLHVDDFPKPSGAETLAGVVQGTPTGTRFKKPVQITFPLAESIPAGTALPVSIFNPSTRQYESSGFVATVNGGEKTASLDVTHFTIFAVSSSQSLQLTKLSPASGSPGNKVVLSGSGLDPLPSPTTVVFAGKGGSTVTSPVLSTSENLLTTIVPVGAVSGKVYVQAGDSQSNGLRFKVQSVTNQAPRVNAGPDQSILLSGATVTNLTGTATDDGLPSGSTLTYMWNVVSGPATVIFQDSKNPNTSGTFTVAGAYVLSLTASDGQLSSSDTVSITVGTPTTTNKAPVVNAGPPQVITLPTSAALAGTVADDGLPTSNLATSWAKVSGPGTVTFGDATKVSTTAAFSAAGTYTLRLTASDTALVSAGDVVITATVLSPVNLPPVVSAGVDKTTTLPGVATLAGTASDDGLPSNLLTTNWVKISGPGTVTFGNSAAVSTTGTFSVPGVYTLRLSASDSLLTSIDDVIITAIAPVQTATNSPPKIGGVQIFPANNVWNTPVDSLPAQRAIDAINDHGGHLFHPDFGSVYNGLFNGIPVNVVSGSSTPKVRVNVTTYASESDALPGGDNRTGYLPIPADVLIEGDPATSSTWQSGADHHLLIIDNETKILHELYSAIRQPDGSIVTNGYSRWDLSSNALRADFWTSTDAAGLPVVPGLIQYDQVKACLDVDPQGTSCTLGHAVRFTLDLTHGPHIWPARHDADSGGSSNPPFGLRVRLKSTVDTSGYSPVNRIILNTLKKYGALLADNGGDWYFQGSPDARWNDDDLHLLSRLVPSDSFEVVDTSRWIVDPDSGEANPNGAGITAVSWPKPGAVLAIDFDDPTNPSTAPGFRSFSTSLYSQAAGYGWQSTNNLGSRTRSASADPLWKDIAVTESPSMQTFLVDVPNGSYSITVFLGDPEYSSNAGLTVSAEGVTQFTLTNTSPGQRLTKTFPVTVSDGQLNLSFGQTQTGSGLAIAGLEIDSLSSGTPQ